MWLIPYYTIIIVTRIILGLALRTLKCSSCQTRSINDLHLLYIYKKDSYIYQFIARITSFNKNEVVFKIGLHSLYIKKDSFTYQFIANFITFDKNGVVQKIGQFVRLVTLKRFV